VLVNEPLKDGDDVLEFISRKNIAERLKGCGEKLSRQLVAWLVLNSIKSTKLKGVRERILSRRRLSLSRMKEDLQSRFRDKTVRHAADACHGFIFLLLKT
jgi:hypothetical protein